MHVRHFEGRTLTPSAGRSAAVRVEAGYDVAIDDVLEPAAFERYWRPWLDGLLWQLVIVLPTLEETLSARLTSLWTRHVVRNP